MKEVEEEREKEERERGGTGARDSFRYPRQAERGTKEGQHQKNKKMRLARCCPMDMHETCKCIPCPCLAY